MKKWTWTLAFIWLSTLLGGCTMQDVSDVLDVTGEVLQAIEKEEAAQQKEEQAAQKNESVNDSTSMLKTEGTTAKVDAELVRPVDGDTAVFAFDADQDGKKEEFSARFLLIDTPETRHPKLGKQLLGDEAKERTAEILSKGNITLEFDVGQRLDKYDRILVYVYVDGVSVQETLLKEGLARVAYVYPPNTRYLTEFEQAEAVAKKKSSGVWAIDGYVTDRGFNSTEK